jgi:hypothetical protein
VINAFAVAEKNFSDYGLNFTPALVRCLLKGTVLAYQNEILWVGEPVLWDGDLLNCEVYDPLAWNCWFAHFLYAPGVPRSAILAMAPFYLPWVAFHRRGGKLRVYSTDRVVRGT